MKVNMDIVVQTQKKYKQQQTTTKDPHLDAILGLDKGPQSTCLLMLPEPITMTGTTHTMDWILRWSLSRQTTTIALPFRAADLADTWVLCPCFILSRHKKSREGEKCLSATTGSNMTLCVHVGIKMGTKRLHIWLHFRKRNWRDVTKHSFF